MGPPPYGYVKNPDGSKSWAVDEEAAAVVRRMFMLYIECRGVEQTAADFSSEPILTSTNYWRSKGINRPNHPSTKEPYHWNASTVTAILRRQEYCGDLLNFKTYSKSYKSKARLKSEPGNIAVFRDVHEAIIPRELWERVQ